MLILCGYDPGNILDMSHWEPQIHLTSCQGGMLIRGLPNMETCPFLSLHLARQRPKNSSTVMIKALQGESVIKASGFFFGGGAIILRHIPKDPKGIQRASMNFYQSSELPQCSLSVWFQYSEHLRAVWPRMWQSSMLTAKCRPEVPAIDADARSLQALHGHWITACPKSQKKQLYDIFFLWLLNSSVTELELGNLDQHRSTKPPWHDVFSNFIQGIYVHLCASLQADGPAWFLYSTEGMQVAHIICFGSVTKSYGTWSRRNSRDNEATW